MRFPPRLCAAALLAACALCTGLHAQDTAMIEKQLTTTPKNHDLDYN